ncbi:MAG: GumC family protein [Thiohalomonadales bacterium]
MENSNDVKFELTLHDYIDIFKRRVLVMVAVFVPVFLLGLTFAIILPAVYRSTGVILIESQKISKSIISSSITGFASERIAVIKQRVMTRENLLAIMEKYNLFQANETRVTSELIDNLRKRIEIEMLTNPVANRRQRNNSTVAFSISFEDRYAELAYGVTNELVTLFLEENIKSRVELASETTRFLSQEAKRLKVNLEKMESLVAAYKQEHANSLPENLGLKTGILQRTESMLAELNRDYKSTENELQRLELEKSGLGIVGSTLTQLKSEYRQAQISYKDTHPTIRALKRKIEILEKEKAENDLAIINGTAGNGVLYNNDQALQLDSLILSTKERLGSLDAQRIPMRKKIAEYEKQIIKTPQVELGLSSLLRDHGSAKLKYEEIQAKQLSAQIAENLEGENKSERFTLIEPPLLADKPIRPNRLKIIFMGLVLAFGAAGGLAFLLEMLNQRIRGRGALAAATGFSPLVEIPYITTSDELLMRKNLIMKSSITIAVLFVLSLFIVHFTYMDLGLLFIQIVPDLG